MDYLTQKPLQLLRWFITACSNRGDIVLEPFSGCATTPVAAEQLGREWIDADIRKGAHDLVLDCLLSEGLAVPDHEWDGTTRQIRFSEVSFTETLQERTDSQEVVVRAFKLQAQRSLERWQITSHHQVRKITQTLSNDQYGLVTCVECGR